MSALHTRGPWRVGRGGGCVVSDAPVENGPRGCAEVEYYGGHLIAESIAKCNAPAIAATPELLDAARRALAECVDLIGTPAGDALSAAIAKATGSDPLDDAIGDAGGRFTI